VRLLLVIFFLVVPAMAFAEDLQYKLTIHDHRFEPAQLRVPAGKRVRLMIENRDSSAEEFDSHALNREKVIPANFTAPVYIGPLTPGQYPFIGEFHSDSAKGVIIVE